MSVHVNLTLNESIWRRFRALCIEHGYTASGVLEKFMGNVLVAANPKKELEKLK